MCPVKSVTHVPGCTTVRIVSSQSFKGPSLGPTLNGNLDAWHDYQDC
jgi:hypothetical protein